MDSQQLDALLEVAKKHNLQRFSYRGEFDFDAEFGPEQRTMPAMGEVAEVVTQDEIIMKQIEEARKAAFKMTGV